MHAIQESIEKLGYHVGEDQKNPRLSKNPNDYWMFLGILLGIFVLYMIISHLGISFNGIINNNAPSLPIVLLIGLTAGISSCMALVGGLILAISAKWNEKNENQSPSKRIVPQLYFNIGRIL